MQGTITNRTLLQPRTLTDALRMMRDEGPLVPMAGCTDLYVGLNFGTLRDTRFLNLWKLDTLRRIERRGPTLSIGALTTYTALIQSPLVNRHMPMLASAAREVGGVQIQNRGTLGGNVANASPAGDTLPVLAAADAVVVLRSAGDERRVPLTRFYSGYRKTVARRDELIVAFEIPTIEGRQFFRKVGTRAAQAISKVVMAAVIGNEPPRIALGSMAPTVIRLAKTEGLLARGGSLEAAQSAMASEIDPIDDLRAFLERLSAAAEPARRSQNFTSCQVTLKVSKSDPRVSPPPNQAFRVASSIRCSGVTASPTPAVESRSQSRSTVRVRTVIDQGPRPAWPRHARSSTRRQSFSIETSIGAARNAAGRCRPWGHTLRHRRTQLPRPGSTRE
jgi:CO/xanthine dehydrogenase FAD-binding subunit